MAWMAPTRCGSLGRPTLSRRRHILVRAISGQIRRDPPVETGKRLFPESSSQSTFPHHSNTPARCLKRFPSSFVPADVSRKFLLPEDGVGCWVRREATSSMPVPETPVDEDCRPPFREDEVRTTGKSSDIDTEAQSHRVKAPADNQLRFGVPTPDGAHVPRARALTIFLTGTHFISDRLRAWPRGPIFLT